MESTRQYMNEYCKQHKDGNFCEKVNYCATDGFCKIVCKGNFDLHRQDSVDEMRAGSRKPIVDNGEMVSVVIPCGLFDEKYLDRTTRSVKENAAGPIEIIVEKDYYGEGVRVLVNKGVEKAKGKYVVKLDAHCAMSPEWDARMKASCKEDTIIKPVIDGLDIDTWKGRSQDMGMVVWDREMRNAFPVFWKTLNGRSLEEESMSIIGCCYMMEKAYYKKLGGCDELLSKWGALGLEWSLKTWLTGGRIVIRTDCVCYHFFRDGPTPFTVELLNETFLKLGRTWRFGRGNGQTRPLSWLVKRFYKYLRSAAVRPTREQRASARCVAANTL